MRTVTALPIAHTTLKIAGIADRVDFTRSAFGEIVLPVEYKRGRPKSHRADEVQLCAQGLCLEFMLGVEVKVGYLFYGELRRRHEVHFDADLRALTAETIQSVRKMILAGSTPRPQYSAARCDRCSLMELCLPRQLRANTDVVNWIAGCLERACDDS